MAWWNPAVEAQATDRAHRAHRAHRADRKAALAENMYSGSVGRKQPLFSESDLAELLMPLAG
jgi:SNF2 family DNA or RNA helicase